MNHDYDRITYYKADLREIEAKLKEALSKIHQVKLAIIFGSITRRSNIRDVDIGVYIEPPIDLKYLLRLACKLEDLLGLPVDLVPLNEAPPGLVLKALQKGIIVKDDSKIRTDLIYRALSEKLDVEMKILSTKTLK